MTNEARIWAIIGILVTLLTAIPPLLPILTGRSSHVSPRRIVELDTTGPLDPLDDLSPLAAMSPLRLVLGGRTIRNLTIWQIRLHNAGEVPIPPNDFIERLQIRVPEPWEILSITSTYPHAGVSLRWTRTAKNAMEATPFLFNPEDDIFQTLYLTTSIEPSLQDKKSSTPVLSVRVPNLLRLTPARDPWENLPRKSAIVYLSFRDAILLLLVASIFLTWYMLLLQRNGFSSLQEWRTRGALLVAMLLSVSVAEVSIYYAFGGGPTNELMRRLHFGGGAEWLNWLVLVLHVSGSSALLIRARRMRLPAQENAFPEGAPRSPDQQKMGER